MTAVSELLDRLWVILDHPDMQSVVAQTASIASEAFAIERERAMGMTEAKPMSAKEKLVCGFILQWSGFIVAGVPFGEYASVAESASNLLRRLITGDYSRCEEVPGYAEFWKQRQETFSRLCTDSRYSKFFEDLQGG